MSFLRSVGSFVNELVKEGTGIDVKGMSSGIKSSYESASEEYQDIIKYEEYYVAIFDYDGYQELKRNVRNNFYEGIKESILYNDRNYTYAKNKLSTLSDHDIKTIERLYNEGKIPTNAKVAVKEELEYRGIY